MKLLLFFLLIPLASMARNRIIDPSEEGRQPIYNDAGWDISHSTGAMNPWTRQLPIGCQGDNCPESFLQKMGENSSKIYDFLLTTYQLSSYEIAYRFGYSDRTDQTKFRAVILIFNEIKESQKMNEPKKFFIQRQVDYVRSSEDLQYRRLKAEVINDLVNRLGYAKRNQ